jgi:phosphate transport system permease protein
MVTRMVEMVGGEMKMDSKVAGLTAVKRHKGSDLTARGEPMVWAMGGSLAFGLLMITGFLGLIFWNGFTAFWPNPIDVVTTVDGRVIAGEPMRTESYKPSAADVAALPADMRATIEAHGGMSERTLYRIGNFDFYSNDFEWLPVYSVKSVTEPKDLMLVERSEWGVFIGKILSITVDGKTISNPSLAEVDAADKQARDLRAERKAIERDKVGAVNRAINAERLKVRKAVLSYGEGSPEAKAAADAAAVETASLTKEFDRLSAEALAVRN